MNRRSDFQRLLASVAICTLFLTTEFALGATLPRPIVDEHGNEIGLFQRVVSRPGAEVIASVDTKNAVEKPVPFTSYYVYDDIIHNGEKYFQVGPNSAQPPVGWINASKVLEWSNNLTLAINPPVNRDRILFFDSPASLAWLLSDVNQVNIKSASFIAKAQAGGISAGDGVNAIEPAEYAHWTTRFYVMPVLDFVVRGQKQNEAPTILVRTAAIPVIDDSNPSAGNCKKDRTVGVVFVLDTTLSTQPYLDKTTEMLQRLSNKIQAAAKKNKVAFGLIGYRDEALPGKDVEYRTKLFQALDFKNDPSHISSVLRQVKAAKESTIGFSEDGLAGLLLATELDWSEYTDRWVILVTDAGVKTSKDGAKGQYEGLETVSNKLYDEYKIGTIALHLATKEAKAAANVSTARDQLLRLSTWPRTAAAYYQIDDGDLDAFGATIESKVMDLMDQPNLPNSQLAQKGATGDPIAQIGLAQRLIWLGDCSNAKPPDVVEGWAIDKALGTPPIQTVERYAVEPRLLLNRVQINELAKTLDSIAEVQKATADHPKRFFERLVLAVGTAAIDPNMINTGGLQGRLNAPSANVDKISDVLPGYLSRLPYKSDFLTLNKASWSSVNPQQMKQYIRRVEESIIRLRSIYNKPLSELYPLHPDATPAERVYPVLLSDLP